MEASRFLGQRRRAGSGDDPSGRRPRRPGTAALAMRLRVPVVRSIACWTCARRSRRNRSIRSLRSSSLSRWVGMMHGLAHFTGDDDRPYGAIDRRRCRPAAGCGAVPCRCGCRLRELPILRQSACAPRERASRSRRRHGDATDRRRRSAPRISVSDGCASSRRLSVGLRSASVWCRALKLSNRSALGSCQQDA